MANNEKWARLTEIDTRRVNRRIEVLGNVLSPFHSLVCMYRVIKSTCTVIWSSTCTVIWSSKYSASDKYVYIVFSCLQHLQWLNWQKNWAFVVIEQANFKSIIYA